MLKKLIAMAMVLAFINVHAAAPVSSLKSLATAYDKLNFALTVEWDQKDKAFHDAQVKEFKKVVMNLQKDGFTNAELLKFAKTQIKNDQVAKDLDALFAVVEINKLTDSEARDFILKTFKESRSEGSSWLGRNANSGLIPLLVVIAIVLALSTESSGESYNGGYYEECYDDYVCYEACYSYSFGSCYTDCVWESSCY